MTRGRRMAVAIAAAGGALAVTPASPAAAASCRVIIVENSPPVGLALSPKHVDVAYGGCVQFTDNAVGPGVTVTVSGGYRTTLTYGESTTADDSYQAKTAGTHDVTASNGAASAHGSITVGASPSPSSSPPASSPPPSPSHSPAPSPRPQPSSSQSTSSGPQIAPTPRPSRTHRQPVPSLSAAPVPSASLVAPEPGATPSLPAPTPSSTSTPVAVVAGPLQPPTDRGLGLPAAVAALALVGVGTALVRVLLAHAPTVDSSRTVGGNA